MLTGDTEMIVQFCGLDFLITLWTHFPSINLFISSKPLIEAKKRYIKKNYNGSNAKYLAKILRCSERFIYEAVDDSQKPRKKTKGGRGR